MLNLLKIRIQNFRNLKDVTIDLKDVHLFIGPNNSGKSNVLQAIRLGSMIVGKNLRSQDNSKYAESISFDEYELALKSIGLQKDTTCVIEFLFQLSEKLNVHLFFEIKNLRQYLFLGITERNSFEKNETSIISLNGYQYNYIEMSISRRIQSVSENFTLSPKAQTGVIPGFFIDTHTYANRFPNMNKNMDYLELAYTQINKFANLPIYEISPKEMRSPSGTTGDKFIQNDASNIVSFLDSMKSRDDEVYPNLKKTLSLITKDFSGFYLDVIDSLPEDHRLRLRFPTSTIKKFGLIDSRNKENTIWAESLSDGILYFLAILCIVHQPNPPAIVLLEEPEKGIHPRRIKEVMDLLFALADEKKIQIILTTHSTFVVNEFKDIPENISVFENTDSLITIQNLKTDIIKKLDADIEKQGYEKVDFTDSLGENWALGLLGGVPI